MNIPKRVARGVALLDEKMPGWESQIDLTNLNMRHGTRCILGQLYGQWWKGCERLNLENDDKLGFSHSGVAAAARYPELTEEWQRVIRERLAPPAEVSRIVIQLPGLEDYELSLLAETLTNMIGIFDTMPSVEAVYVP